MSWPTEGASDARQGKAKRRVKKARKASKQSEGQHSDARSQWRCKTGAIAPSFLPSLHLASPCLFPGPAVHAYACAHVPTEEGVHPEQPASERSEKERVRAKPLGLLAAAGETGTTPCSGRPLASTLPAAGVRIYIRKEYVYTYV